MFEDLLYLKTGPEDKGFFRALTLEELTMCRDAFEDWVKVTEQKYPTDAARVSAFDAFSTGIMSGVFYGLDLARAHPRQTLRIDQN